LCPLTFAKYLTAYYYHLGIYPGLHLINGRLCLVNLRLYCRTEKPDEEDFIKPIKVNAGNRAELRAIKSQYNLSVSQLNISKSYPSSQDLQQQLDELKRLKEQIEKQE
jgi:hypothetical protein